MHFSKAAERAAWVEDLCQCGLLLLDEPDKLKPSEGLVEIIYGILDERLSDGKVTILTTNASGQELERRWGDEEPGRLSFPASRSALAGSIRREPDANPMITRS
jgi:hypothetical protein